MRAGNDAGGYTCYENAGRGYVQAPNEVFDNSFDNAVASFALPFPVSFYGTTVTTGTIDSNGFVVLGNQLACGTNCYSGIKTSRRPGSQRLRRGQLG